MKSNLFKKFIQYKKTITIFVILFLLLLSTPHVLSTSIGKKLIVKIFQKKGYYFDAKKLKFSWLGPQNFSNLNISNKETQIYVENLSYYSNFINLLKKKIFSKNISFEVQNGSITIDNTIFFKNINAYIKKENFLYIKGIGDISYLEHQKGLFIIDLKYKKDFYSGYINLKNFPPLIIEELKLLKNKGILLKNFLGKTIDVKSNFNIQNNEGPFDVIINSKNSFLSIYGNYKNREIFLQKDLIARLYIEEGQNIFSNLQMETPLFIKISKEGFILPIDLNIKKINIDNALIYPGKFKIKNDSLNLIVKFLKSNSLISPDKIDVWAAPFIATLNNGKLDIHRADFLLENSIHLFTWGVIDIINNKIKMFLGIPSNTLSKSFNIKNIPSNYNIKIPVSGTLQKINIDTKNALYQITALKIKEKKPLFKLFDIFKPEKANKDIPKANRPFPWEK